MTNDKKNAGKDRTVAPRSLSDSIADDTLGAGEAVDATVADTTATAAPGVETISLEEAGLGHERGSRDKGTEGGASRAAGVMLIVFLTLIAAGAGAALGPLIHGKESEAPDLAPLESRLAALETSLAGLSGVSDTLAALGQEADALKQRVAALEETPVVTTGGDVPTVDVSALTQRISALEHGVTALAARVDGVLDQKLATIDTRIASLEGSAASADQGATETADETATGTVAATDGTLTAEVDAMQKSLADLTGKLESLSGATAGIDGLKTQLDALAGELAALSAATADIGTLRSDVATLNERATDPRAAFALAVGQLREDVLAGDGYSEALATAESLAPEDADSRQALAALRPWETDGVATRTRLADALNAAAYRAVEESRRDTAEGWFDKTVAELASIVSIRRVDGESGGSTADDVTARAEARLRQDDLAGAIEEMASLTGAAAEAAAGWLEMARARLAAEQAVDTLSARAIALVGGAAG